MIVSKTPLRVSFFGGGSDIPQFFEEHDGLCVSTTIDSYIYLAVNRCISKHLKVVYSELELETDIDNIKHDRVREILKHYRQKSNIEICSFSDIPTKGTGLGSSSTFTVGLINAIHRILTNSDMDKKFLAELACYIEIDKCNQPIGKQDQYAAAYGGLNAYWFKKNDVEVQPIDISFATGADLNSRLLFFNTGVNRLASSVLTEQVDNLKKKTNIDYTKLVVDFAVESIKMLERNKLNEFGELLGQSWEIKKKLSSNVSNSDIDEMYHTALRNGAIGGKILGAGGGGYLMVYVPEKHQYKVISAMSKYQKVDFKFDHKGSRIEMAS
jgi:D-glycero-alpha-D-manno-heptose-7-phosphate kinase